ncbi:MAG: hypothetical protein R6X02_05185 [Enhygromyxa sp.]
MSEARRLLTREGLRLVELCTSKLQCLEKAPTERSVVGPGMLASTPPQL